VRVAEEDADPVVEMKLRVLGHIGALRRLSFRPSPPPCGVDGGAVVCTVLPFAAADTAALTVGRVKSP
jgi:hypothetical protein